MLLPGLLDGCGYGSNCPADPAPEEENLVEILAVPEGLVDSAVDAWGELAPDACEVLCTSGEPALQDYTQWRVDEVRSCEVLPVVPVEAVLRFVDGGVPVSCDVRATFIRACYGRSHASVGPAPVFVGHPVAAWLARTAWEEAASVGAFRRLARELARHGAPAGLVAQAHAAARDEIRHARAMRRLAGVRVPPVRFGRPPQRRLFDLAVENAVEGCVRETFAALLVHHQARHAVAPLRPIFARIAADETRHGQWSWDLDAWLRTRLGRMDRLAVRDARASAAAAVAVGDPPPTVRRVLGLPSPSRARALAAAFVAVLVASLGA